MTYIKYMLTAKKYYKITWKMAHYVAKQLLANDREDLKAKAKQIANELEVKKGV